MKKILALILASLVCFSLVACTGNTTLNKEELLDISKPLTREEIDKSIGNIVYAKDLIGNTYTFNGEVVEVKEDHVVVTFYISDEKGNYATNEFMMTASLYLPVEEFKLLEISQGVSFVGTLDDVITNEITIPEFGSQTVTDMIFKSVAIVSDRFESTGKLHSKNISYGENAWNIKFPDSDFLSVVHFRDDVSAYKDKEITYSYKKTDEGSVDAYIVE